MTLDELLTQAESQPQAATASAPQGLDALLDAAEQGGAESMQTQTFDKPVWNPEAPLDFSEEHPLALALAGGGKGVADVFKNVANVFGADSAPSIVGEHGGFDLHMTDTSDEGLAAFDEEYKGITDTTAGGIGEFVGEAVALAPLGVVGGVANKISAGAKVGSMLPTAMKILAGGVEGAAGGAILAGPGDRVSGGLLGGALGGTLTGVGQAGSRLVKDGLAKMRKPAQDALKYIKKQTGNDVSLPLTLGADAKAGSVSANAASFADTASLMPAGKGAVESQLVDLGTDLYEADLRKAFSYNRSVSNRAVAELRESGDMLKAIEAGMGKKGYLPREAKILKDAANNVPRGRYTGNQLLRSATDWADPESKLSKSSFVEEANSRIDLMPRGDKTPAGAATLDARDKIRFFNKVVGSSAGVTASVIPGVAKFVSSPSFQNFVMGNTKWQRRLQEVMASGNGQEFTKVLGHIRRAMSSQYGGSDDLQEKSGVNTLVKTLGAQ